VGVLAAMRILRITMRMVIHAGLRAMRQASRAIRAAIARAMLSEKPLPNRCFCACSTVADRTPAG